MGSVFNNAAFVHNANFIEVPEALQAMGHHNQGLIAGNIAQKRKDLLLCLCIQPFCGFVQQP